MIYRTNEAKSSLCFVIPRMEIGNYSSANFQKISETPRVFNVSKTGIASLKTLAALVIVIGWAGYV